MASQFRFVAADASVSTETQSEHEVRCFYLAVLCVCPGDIAAELKRRLSPKASCRICASMAARSGAMCSCHLLYLFSHFVSPLIFFRRNTLMTLTLSLKLYSNFAPNRCRIASSFGYACACCFVHAVFLRRLGLYCPNVHSFFSARHLQKRYTRI